MRGIDAADQIVVTRVVVHEHDALPDGDGDSRGDSPPAVMVTVGDPAGDGLGAGAEAGGGEATGVGADGS